MLGVLINLLEAERTHNRRPILLAGIYGFFLGNIHTFDVITLAVIWISYIAAKSVCERRVHWAMISRATAAGIPSILAIGYMVWGYRTDAVFAQRAGSLILTPPIWWVLLGFGLLVPLTSFGFRALRLMSSAPDSPGVVVRYPHLFLAVWPVANVLAAYIPLDFQRNLLMGAHVPFSLLAGVGLWYLLTRFRRATWKPWAALAIVVLAMSNVLFLFRDLHDLPYLDHLVRAFLLPGERTALEWVRGNVRRDVAVQPLPWIAGLRARRTAESGSWTRRSPPLRQD